MKLWKCFNCVKDNGVPGEEFFADKAQCPTCGLSQDDPRHGGKIVQCKIIHFDPPHDVVAGAGKNYLACSKKPIANGAVATGVLDVVNCPLCVQSDEYQAVKTKIEENDPDTIGFSFSGKAAHVLKDCCK